MCDARIPSMPEIFAQVDDAAPVAAPAAKPEPKDKLAAATGGDAKKNPENAVKIQQTESGEFMMEKGPKASNETVMEATNALMGKTGDIEGSMKSAELQAKAVEKTKEQTEKINEGKKENLE